MPRKSRVVIPGLPHHITQRGARRHNVFFETKDHEVYLALLKLNADKYGVDIVAYCLMTNHTHLLLVPHKSDSLRWTLQLTHKTYAEYANAKNGWKGHLWQERFYSSPVDEDFFWVALRYIERNPVEAKLVKHASEYAWSTASHHSKNKLHPYENPKSEWSIKIQKVSDWHERLRSSDSSEAIERLRRNTSRDLPTGSEVFLDTLERVYDVKSRCAIIGRPPKKGKVVTVTTL